MKDMQLYNKIKDVLFIIKLFQNTSFKCEIEDLICYSNLIIMEFSVNILCSV